MAAGQSGRALVLGGDSLVGSTLLAHYRRLGRPASGTAGVDDVSTSKEQQRELQQTEQQDQQDREGQHQLHAQNATSGSTSWLCVSQHQTASDF